MTEETACMTGAPAAALAELPPHLCDGVLARDARVFRPHVVATPDGPLQAYAAGRVGAPVVVLANPLGISCLFMARLAQRLAEDFHVLTWEHRGLPDARHPVPASLQAHVHDMAALLASVGTGAPRCHALVAYCSGAHLAALALAQGSVQAARLCLVSPSFDLGPDAPKTAYQRAVMPLWPRVVRDGPRMAALVRILLGQSGRAPADALDAELEALNHLPFASDERLMRYAHLLAQTCAQDAPQLLARIDVPSLVLHSELDDIVHPQTAATCAALLAHGTLTVQPGEGHFAIYRSAAMREQVARFLGARHPPHERTTAP